MDVFLFGYLSLFVGSLLFFCVFNIFVFESWILGILRLEIKLIVFYGSKRCFFLIDVILGVFFVKWIL